MNQVFQLDLNKKRYTTRNLSILTGRRDEKLTKHYKIKLV